MMERIILVTGATDGIGLETARQLAAGGARVLVHGRTQAKAEAARERLAAAVPGAGERLEAVAGDFSALAEVRALAEAVRARHERLDVLVNNAGLISPRHQLSADGHELTMAVNHLAPFLLTHLLLPALERAAAGRVVNVASMVHMSGHIDPEHLDQPARNYDGYAAYAASKLANVLFTYELARRLGNTWITANALHPGVIATKLLRTGFGGGGAGVEGGALTSVRLATDPALDGVTGRYFTDGREAPSSRASHDRGLQRRLYEVSAAITGVTPLPG